MTPEKIRVLLPPEWANKMADDLIAKAGYGEHSSGIMALRNYAHLMLTEHPRPDDKDIQNLIDGD